MSRTIARTLSSHRAKWVVLAVWIGLLVFGGMFGSKLTQAQNNETASWLPSDAESTQALEALEEFQSPDALTAVIVYERAGGITPADMQAAATDAEEFGSFDGVTGKPLGPFPSEDGEALQTIVTFDLGPDGWELAPDIAGDMHEFSDETAPDGLDMYVAGPLGGAADSAEAFAGIDGLLLVAALGVVIVLLLLTYRSPVLWVLPIFSAVAGLLVAQGVIYLLAEHAGLTVNGQSAGILTVLVIGAGTDYALLLVARYREELRLHDDRHEAMAEALYRAGPAILASGGTVILGMLCLLAATMNSTQGPGRHDDPPAGTAGHLRAVGLLAGPAAVRHPRADRDGDLGQDGKGDRSPRAHRLGDDHGAAGRCLARSGLAGRERPHPGRGVQRRAGVDPGRRGDGRPL
jgi:RND superfamily putative drug exporter